MNNLSDSLANIVFEYQKDLNTLIPVITHLAFLMGESIRDIGFEDTPEKKDRLHKNYARIINHVNRHNDLLLFKFFPEWRPAFVEFCNMERDHLKFLHFMECVAKSLKMRALHQIKFMIGWIKDRRTHY